jgi:hypothetical protein
MPKRGARTQPASHSSASQASSFARKQVGNFACRPPTHLITICKGSKMVPALKHRANNLQPPTFHSC